jgi:hypothetical protein
MGTGSIIFTKGLETINPVYNESIIEFYPSIISDATYATVTIAGAEFTIYQLIIPSVSISNKLLKY